MIGGASRKRFILLEDTGRTRVRQAQVPPRLRVKTPEPLARFCRLLDLRTHEAWPKSVQTVHHGMIATKTKEPVVQTTRIGEAFTNRDGAISVRLDAIPVSGAMCLRAARPNERTTAKYWANHLVVG